jgi:hypothetical protein
LIGGIFFRQIGLSHFDLLVGNVGDSRFNGVILEHWWQVLQGTAQWLSPSFFYPAQGILGYSDAGFLNALPYVILRLIRIDPFSSYQIVLFVLVAVGWIGTILFFRCCLKVSIVSTVFGAALFVFPNAMANSVYHTQLFTVYFIPFLAIGIYISLTNLAKTAFIKSIVGIFVAIMIPAIFYTSYYIGWFFLFFILLLSGVGYAWSMIHSHPKTTMKYIVGKLRKWQEILPYCALSTICFIPFLLTYIPVLRKLGGRSFTVIATMLPSFIDYVNVGPGNWLWGKKLYSTFVGIGSRPMSWELTKGVPVFLLLTCLALVIYFIRKIRDYQLTVTQFDTYKIIVNGKVANHNEELAIMAAGLSVAVFLSWLLMLKIKGFSLWWLVTKLIPGASAIRAVYRFQHVLAFPIAIVVAIGFQQSLNHVMSHIRSFVKRSAYVFALVVCCLVLLGEQFNTGSLANYSKQQQRDMLAGISNAPPQAKVFALLPVVGLRKPPYESQIDAIIIAQKYSLNTINGYSGDCPPGWGGIYDPAEPEYIVSLVRWIQYYSLETYQLFFLDANTGTWLSALNMLPRIDERVVIMNGPLREKEFALELSVQKVPIQWQRGEFRQFTIRAKNNGSVELSSVGGDINNLGKYVIALSYRWLEPDSSVPLSGFETRTYLPAAVKPNAEIIMNMEIKAPSRPGKYWLEIEVVQELIAWFKDKGSPGIRIELEIL